MCDVWNYIMCIPRSRSEICTQTNLVWWNDWINMRWHVVMRMWCHAWIRVCWHTWIMMIRIICMYILSMQNAWNSFLKKTWVGNVYSIMVICRKFAGVIPMSTSVVTITMKTRWYTMITWMMGGRRSGPRPIYTSTNAFNNL